MTPYEYFYVLLNVACILSVAAVAATVVWAITYDVLRLRRTTSVELRSERCERCTGDVSPCYVDGLGIRAAVLIKRNGRMGEIQQILLDGQRPRYEVRYVDLQQLVTNSWFVADELQPLDGREADPAEFASHWDASESTADA